MLFSRRELRNCARDKECDVTESSCYTAVSVVNYFGDFFSNQPFTQRNLIMPILGDVLFWCGQ